MRRRRGASRTVVQREGDLDELSSRMLAAVGVKHGKNSTQYEQAGGTRTSESKAPVCKTTTTTAA